MAYQKRLTVNTLARAAQEITAEVAVAVYASGIDCGLCNVFVQHTRCSLMITENADPDVRRDLETVFSRLAPDGDPAYAHDAEGPDDMSAHARSVLTSSALTIPVGNGRLMLGTWQGIFLWEHRDHGAARQVVVTLLSG